MEERISWGELNSIESMKLTFQRPCDYSYMTYEKLSEGSGIQWPCNEANPNGTERLFVDGKFFTGIEECESFGHDLETGAPYDKAQYTAMNPNGRAILKSCHYVPEAEGTSDEFPLQLSTGRRARHFHTRTKTGRVPELQNRDPESYIQISDEDAKELEIVDGEMVVAESKRGQIEVKARVGLMAKGQVFVPFHYGYFDRTDDRARAANELTQERWDSVSKQPLFKSGAVRVKKVNGVQVHAKERHTSFVEKKEQDRTQPGDYAGKNDKRARLLETWMSNTITSFETLRDICDHVIPQVEGADFEISSGMQVMHGILTSCIDRAKPICEKYNIKQSHRHEMSETLRKHLFPEQLLEFSGSPTYDVMRILTAFYLFLAQIEAHLIALLPAAQAVWDEEFVKLVEHQNEQIGRIKAWTQQQLKSRGPQILMVPCREGVTIKDKIAKKIEENEKR